VGEVSGMVFKNEAGNSEGLGRITLDIFDKDNILVGRTMSEFDGYYSYLGLAPGNYVVKVDTQQSKKLHLTSTPSQQEFTIRKNRDGDIVEGKDFGLKQTSP
jgi:phage protein U